MLKNFFKIAIRNIKRYSTFSVLNITGMAIGMTCAFLLLLWVRYEISYDRYHKNAARLYRLVQTEKSEGKIHQMATTPFPLAGALKEEFPEVSLSTRFHSWPTSFRKGENIVQGKLALVDPDFFEMFHIDFVQGDKKTALNGLHNIVITEEMAKRYFGKDDPFGKTLTIDPDQNLTVTGIIKNLPRNSNIFADCIAPFEFYGIKYGGSSDKKVFNEWRNVYCYSFVELIKGADSKLVEDKIKGEIQRNKKDSNAEVQLQNIRKIHLNSRKYEGDIATGNIIYVRLAGLIAMLILTIACINFMNLSTAQSSGRAKEIGVRRVAGANRSNIITQFLGETLLIVFIAHVIAMIIVELLLPGFKNFMFMEINYRSAGLYLFLIAIVLFCGLLGGCYPAFYLSSLKPVNTMKGVIGRNPGNSGFIRAMVILQFILSFIFIICTIIVKNQLNYLQNKDIGLDIHNICHFELANNMRRETLKNELITNPDILSVTFTPHQDVLNIMSATGGVNWRGKKEGTDVLFSILNTDRDFAKTFQLEMKEGSFLSSNEFSPDTTVLVINEKAAATMGFNDPVGEVLSDPNGIKFRIIGVVKDFNFKSLHSPVEPLVISPVPGPANGGTCYIRMKPGHIPSAIDYIKKTLKSFNNDTAPDFRFLGNDFNGMYVIERIAATLLGYITILAILISCLGLIGLSTFMTVSRTKEIGIRKVNGAKSAEIFSMLSKEYIKLVIISFLIATPIAWFATRIWLQGYVYRVKAEWWVFALAFVITALITMLTVGFQSYRAASRNPVEALRYE